mmetsp:Transcript_19319/g.18649  ORF Transcript_19319/g.18649 Transcript_19319/m.18649 type:complete len:253 (+) Transcript_19319:99-857(+)
MLKNNTFLISLSKKLNNFTSYIQPLSEPSEKKKVLLIRAHPVPESYSTALANAAEKGLRLAGHDVRVRSLYFHGNKEECYAGKEFPCVLNANERRGYMDVVLTKERETGNSNLSQEVIEAVEDLRWCDSVVYVFPTWWFSLPAIVKGYLDRVLLPGISFKLPDASMVKAGQTGLIPGLTNIKKIGVITTYGCPFHVVLYCGDSSRSIITNGVRPLFGENCVVKWNGLYNMDNVTKEERDQFLDRIINEYKSF